MSKCLGALFLVASICFGREALQLKGDYWGVHDPSIAKEKRTWYVFATGKTPDGGQLPIRCSENLRDWRMCGQVFDRIPEWIRKESPGTTSLWAPDISSYKGEFWLYYAYSLFGKNTSGIALATNRTLDPKSSKYKWVDKGLVLKSTASDNYNAIDPNVVQDGKGKRWLALGSFWSGIKLVRLGDDGKLSAMDPKLWSIAARSQPADAAPGKPGSPARWQAVEAPFLVRHGRYFYLFVSWDLCCRGAKSTYNTRVGRASEITGPYLDRAGTPMSAGGGTELLVGNPAWSGPGGESAWVGKSQDLLAFHAYDAVSGKSALQISTIDWSEDWPHVSLGTQHEAAPK